jgi:hypothetical protein
VCCRVMQCVCQCVTVCCSQFADAMGHGSVRKCVTLCCTALQAVASCCKLFEYIRNTHTGTIFPGGIRGSFVLGVL